MTYDRQRDARLLVLMRAAKVLGGPVASYSTPPAQWHKRAPWIDKLEAWVLALHRNLLTSYACHIMAAGCYADAAKMGGGGTSIGDQYIRSQAEQAAMLSAYEFARAAAVLGRWAEVGEILGRIR